jgi:hypothetical protein
LAVHAPPYRREQDVFLIEMHLGHIVQLFNTLDPSPFLERDLDPNAEHYLLGAVEELPAGAPFKILLHLPAGEREDPAATQAADAIHHYFSGLASEARRGLRAHLRAARAALVMGGLFLAACLGFSGLIESRFHGLFAEFLSEGALILGWVALWRPLDMFLYAWRPLRRQLRNLERISTARVELACGGCA